MPTRYKWVQEVNSFKSQKNSVEKYFKCKECGKVFVHLSHLKIHQKFTMESDIILAVITGRSLALLSTSEFTPEKGFTSVVNVGNSLVKLSPY